LLKTLQPMDRHLSQSYSEVTRLQFQLLQAITNIGLSICRLEIFITTFVVDTGMALYFLGFWPFPKVCILFLHHNTSPNWFIETADKEYSDNAKFCKFCRQLFHSSLTTILRPLKPGMIKPEITHFPDGHF
jgi:Plavaka transposase